MKTKAQQKTNKQKTTPKILLTEVERTDDGQVKLGTKCLRGHCWKEMARI